MDLWAEIGILDGGERLGKFIGRYREAYFKAGSMNPATGVVFQYKPREGAEELIYQRISDITISMKALDYLNMPDFAHFSLFREEQGRAKIGRRNNNSTGRGSADFHFAAFRMYFEIFHRKRRRNGEK